MRIACPGRADRRGIGVLAQFAWTRTQRCGRLDRSNKGETCMARYNPLTDDERRDLLDIPTDEAAPIRHYTLTNDRPTGHPL